MANYYEILGLHTGASFAEIKAAFRRLAKIYHPDKNPGGKDQFTQILKAYETLSDPKLKSTYDYRLNYNSIITQTSYSKSGNTKNWSFEEKELKRRKYYDEHIKKYAKTKETYKQTTEGKKHYNEFKYILFATPIAAGLFLLIFYLATPKNPKLTKPLQQNEFTKPDTTALRMGDAPYSNYFGRSKYDTVSNLSLTIKNNTHLELIVCLFKKQKFIRSCYIAKGFYAKMLELPKDSLIIKYCSGLCFNYSHPLNNARVFGGFKENIAFFESELPVVLNSINELTLHNGMNEGFKNIDEKTFFYRD